MASNDERRAVWERFSRDHHALSVFGCFGGPPEPSHRFRRFLAVISFEDASDVSDYTLEADSLDEAASEHRAIDVYDLDTGQKYDVEWTQHAVPTPEGNE